MAITERPWAPAADETLFWFRAASPLPARPRPLDFTLEVYALTGGLTRGLVSLNYPLYQIRPKLIDGELYVASVPSGIAEREPETKLGLLRDASLRFTRNIRGPWEKAIKPEVQGYSAWMAEDLPDSPAEVAERFRQARRVREMQWFVADRAVVGSFALLKSRLDDMPASAEGRDKVAAAVEDGAAVLKEAMQLIREEGGARLEDFVRRTSRRLVDMQVLAPGDIHWLEWREVRRALTEPGGWKAIAADRKTQAEKRTTASVPDEVGPNPGPTALHMHLVHEVLALLAA
ncbi:MAG TPA: hypothetical protein VGK54_12025 [Chloroflexota bacterium]